MANNTVVSTAEVLEGNDWFLTYRILRPDGAVLVPGDCSSSSSVTNVLTVNIYRLQGGASDEDKAVYTDTIEGDNMNIVIMSSLKTDGWWGGVDSTGYNFFLKIPVGATFPGGQRYRIEFQLILTAVGDSAHGLVPMGTIRWASIIYVKPMVS